MADVRRQVRRVARARRTTLILGPTGVGKEVVAQELHRQAVHDKAPFVPVHCGALPEQLAEAELFGHTRGAFTGASTPRPGLIRAADGGTLFLDEIDALTPALQAKLLRFLESGEVRPVGSDKTTVYRSWVLAASNQDLEALVDSGRFRADLLYRLDLMRLELPPLAEREDDVLELARYFLGLEGFDDRTFTADARAAMLGHDWPGNVRELKHRVERAALCSDGPIAASDLRLDGKRRRRAPIAGAPRGGGGLDQMLWDLVDQRGMSLSEAVADCERRLIQQALVAEHDNRTKAAQRLGIHVRTIFKKLSRPTR